MELRNSQWSRGAASERVSRKDAKIGCKGRKEKLAGRASSAGLLRGENRGEKARTSPRLGGEFSSQKEN